MNSGTVYLVGAGPGDPELLTLRGLRRLQQADVVVHDRLVSPRLVEAAPAKARRIDVGKRAGDHPWPQDRINRLLVAEARRGRRVVRLKGGDPFVFGRGGEECDALREAGIAFEVVPGVSSVVAAPAAAGVPITDRRHVSAYTAVSGHACGEPDDPVDWDAAARSGTVVVVMGLSRIARIAARLVAAGLPRSTPAAIVGSGSTNAQQVARATLADIATRADGIASPATLVVGTVAAMQLTSAGAVATSTGNSRPAGESVA